MTAHDMDGTGKGGVLPPVPTSRVAPTLAVNVKVREGHDGVMPSVSLVLPGADQRDPSTTILTVDGVLPLSMREFADLVRSLGVHNHATATVRLVFGPD